MKDEIKYPKVWKNISEHLVTFARETTIHGIPLIMIPRIHFLERHVFYNLIYKKYKNHWLDKRLAFMTITN